MDDGDDDNGNSGEISGATIPNSTFEEFEATFYIITP